MIEKSAASCSISELIDGSAHTVDFSEASASSFLSSCPSMFCILYGNEFVRSVPKLPMYTTCDGGPSTVDAVGLRMRSTNRFMEVLSSAAPGKIRQVDASPPPIRASFAVVGMVDMGKSLSANMDVRRSTSSWTGASGLSPVTINIFGSARLFPVEDVVSPSTFAFKAVSYKPLDPVSEPVKTARPYLSTPQLPTSRPRPTIRASASAAILVAARSP
mmetsp:Transcript_13413/g.20388  ORF Transcript_13413/g.20388 Transcript_13413/m.20388 type:complete len:217 (-) Transcript_13413:613-1263(-)